MCTAKQMIPCGSHSKHFESFLIVSTKTGKKIFENQCQTFEKCERAVSMLTAGMSARDVARHFQHHLLTISRLLNRFQQTGKVVNRPRSGRPRKTTPREDRILTASS